MKISSGLDDGMDGPRICLFAPPSPGSGVLEEAMTGQGESLTVRAILYVGPRRVYPPPRREGIKRGNQEKNRNKNNKVPFPFHLNWLSVILHKFDFKLLLCNLWKIILN